MINFRSENQYRTSDAERTIVFIALPRAAPPPKRAISGRLGMGTFLMGFDPHAAMQLLACNSAPDRATLARCRLLDRAYTS